MVKKITLLLLCVLMNSVAYTQTSIASEDSYNGFSSRSFMKFNNFMTVPTFSLLHRETSTIEAISRSSNIEFEDASRLHVLSYSGKMQPNVGAGIAVFQQEIGVFKDFGAMANYAYQIDLNAKTKLTFGFNFFYSRRSLDEPRVLTNTPDPLINNYQDRPVVVFQPAATVSFGNFDVGLFFENLGDFNLKTSEFVTSFGDKTISAHAAYTHRLKNTTGLFAGTTIRGLGIARRTNVDGFSFAATALADLPKVGWLKVGYDKLFGLNAGFGINLNKRLSIGFSYEKQENLSGTNEVGLIYRLGRSRSSKRPGGNVFVNLPGGRQKETIERREQEYKDEEHNDLSDEIRIAQDSIDILNKKVDEILKKLENQPTNTNTTTIIKEVVPTTPDNEARDQSLPRRSAKPWREQTVTERGGGGTMYYTAIEQFKSLKRAQQEVKKYNNKKSVKQYNRNNRKKVKARYVRDPKYNVYVVYIDRHAKEEDAEKQMEEINGVIKNTAESDDDTGGGLGDITATNNTSSSSKDRVYVMRVTLGPEGETYKVPKTQPRARIQTMSLEEGLEPGYYMQIGVFSKKPYADRLLDELEKDGFKPGYFINPKTGNRHIYLHKTQDRKEILNLYNNNFKGKYYDRKSLIHIR
ncbi:PorP/SprF family type IX secretion system membrane protein [uncultured Tenacibaculum sp.]|uniref:PorP/SprF family type IX secretion system membrane protein n=1 Tax=uncultured Tenacibaculum sp. TaxID=174713 RepID=UPI0026384D16|nr:PorP/SprF family type IX secretion system membrane protein [uncultured Tenacibaculum sp.]